MLSLFIALNAFLCIMFNSLFGFRQWKIQTKGQCQNFNYVIDYSFFINDDEECKVSNKVNFLTCFFTNAIEIVIIIRF